MLRKYIRSRARSAHTTNRYSLEPNCQCQPRQLVQGLCFKWLNRPSLGQNQPTLNILGAKQADNMHSIKSCLA
eukprot:615105-Pleurochrysis_carterae.AAC.2